MHIAVALSSPKHEKLHADVAVSSNFYTKLHFAKKGLEPQDYRFEAIKLKCSLKSLVSSKQRAKIHESLRQVSARRCWKMQRSPLFRQGRTFGVRSGEVLKQSRPSKKTKQMRFFIFGPQKLISYPQHNWGFNCM